MSQDKYNYSGKQGECQGKPVEKVYQVYKCTHVNQSNDKALESAVINQPTTVMIDASDKEFQVYSKGIFKGSKCSTSSFNQALLLVGFDFSEERFTKKKDYFWRAKNSLGTSWGIKGYI